MVASSNDSRSRTGSGVDEHLADGRFGHLKPASTVALLALVLAATAAWWFVLHTPGPDPHCDRLPANVPDVTSNITRHVEHLAGEIGPRSLEQPDALEQAAAYVRQQLDESGWRTTRQPVGPQPGYHNVIGERGDDAGPLLVVGAHYDTVPGSPGADDNASGVAVLLEVARLLPVAASSRVRLVAFTNEEGPLGWTELRGSRVAAAESRRRREKIAGVLALESVGYFSDEPGSQRHPAWLGWLFPHTAEFLTFVANPASRPLLHRSAAAFRAASALPVETIAIWPRLVPDVRRSDHAPYWDRGYPALMITGTAEFRNPHYHEPSDLPATLDLDRLAETAVGVASMVRCLAVPGTV